MKRILAFLLAVCCIIPLASCKSEVNDDIVFGGDQIVSDYFNGIGVEWGVYEDTNKLAKGAWDRVTALVDRLNPALVRCMINYDWLVGNLDKKGNDDPADDTWTYDFDNKYMSNCCDILDYCQNKGIKVAFGAWNTVGTVGEDDIWGMIPNATSDIRWAKMTADVLDYLVRDKGYTCIRWFVNSNEPNYIGSADTSKNAYNTYEKWEQGVRNVRAALDAIELTHIDVVGGDTTGFTGSADYLPKIAANLSDVINNYGVHMYISNLDIDRGVYGENMAKLYKAVKDIDKNLGKTKPLLIWESGLLDGKDNATDSNRYIANYSYAIRMADLTVQSILAGVNGIAYWDLDDAMHFMYSEGGVTPKEWGMFSTLAASSALKQEVRPWYHSSVLLTNLLSAGSRIYSAPDAQAEDFRTLAVVSGDGTGGGVILLNRSASAVTKTVRIEEEIAQKQEKLYLYIFNETALRLGADGFAVPNYVIDGNVNNVTELEIPANSMVILSTELL